ncbi:MAG: biotin/lipoyl-containing protein [Candidatus Promineifilaceae bacterium]|nr:biotin/lipoyl-containing protein [Candidatus Promineifilaceae bacterium]
MAKLAVTIDDQTYDIELSLSPQCGAVCFVTIDGTRIPITVPDLENPALELEWIIVDGRPYELTVEENLQWIKAYSGLHRVKIHDHEAAVVPIRSSDGRVKAPIPGLITQILVEEGQEVTLDQPLLVLEAMKMENEIRAPLDGHIETLSVEQGQTVAQNDILVSINR